MGIGQRLTIVLHLLLQHQVAPCERLVALCEREEMLHVGLPLIGLAHDGIGRRYPHAALIAIVAK